MRLRKSSKDCNFFLQKVQGDHATTATLSREPCCLSVSLLVEYRGHGVMADEGVGFTGTRVSAKANVRKRFVGIRSFTGPKSNKLAGEITWFLLCLTSCIICKVQWPVFRDPVRTVTMFVPVSLKILETSWGLSLTLRVSPSVLNSLFSL